MKIIESVPATAAELSVPNLLGIFEKLSYVAITEDALLHENFSTLIDSVKLNQSFLNAQQFVGLFRHICNAEVPLFDELSELVVNNLLKRITSLTVDDIIDTDFVIRKYYVRNFKLSQLFEKLRQKTRASFVDKANNVLAEQQPYDRLMRMLKYLDNNQTLMAKIDTERLNEQLLLTNDSEFSRFDAACVIVTMARLRALSDSSKQLLNKAFRIWCSRAEDTDDVRAMLQLLVYKKLKGIDLSPFHNTMCIEHCTKLTIESANVSIAAVILDFFNRMVCICVISLAMNR